jgi:hypothetical protein
LTSSQLFSGLEHTIGNLNAENAIDVMPPKKADALLDSAKATKKTGALMDRTNTAKSYKPV